MIWSRHWAGDSELGAAVNAVFLCVEQQGAEPTESKEVGVWHRRGLKRSSGQRAVPQVPGV